MINEGLFSNFLEAVLTNIYLRQIQMTDSSCALNLPCSEIQRIFKK
jgi:hypothetical protein